jgi:hypothetical protein
MRQFFASRADAVNNGLFRAAVFFDAAPAQCAYNSAVAFLAGISVAGSTLRFVLTRHPNGDRICAQKRIELFRVS